MISVIVPAFNEETVIARTLGALMDQETDIPYEVIVVANGCTDDTATIARSLARQAWPGRRLAVIETPEGSKTLALNMGDAAARFDFRFYCDADVLVGPTIIDVMARALPEMAGAVYASFTLNLAPSPSLMTRAYGRMWMRLPLLSKMPHGIGCYATNAQGLAQRGPYPEIIADDYFARLSFTPAQRMHIAGPTYQFALPDGLHELLAVRSRWSRGHAQLVALRPDLVGNEDVGSRYEGFGFAAVRHPFDAAIFALVFAYGKLRGIWSRVSGAGRWERATRRAAG
ncbi:glycosyltransferase [Sphingobium aquiterrae]|uniref:glycosyltransferase family 2 protein n=1 Tax=Sphingobium aquiterrae TaxID=2038656 RepID=UPI0030167541